MKVRTKFHRKSSIMSIFKKILVTTDFSKNATAVYDFTQQIAEKFDSVIDLIHVTYEPRYFPVDIHAVSLPVDESKKKEFQDRLKNKLETEFRDNIPENHRGKTILKSGNTADEINACAREGGYNLIMIASRGEGNSIFNKGSVTEKLMRISNVPVWSVLRESETAIKTIVVPTDGSNVSFEALTLAHNLATKSNAKIDLLSISKTDFPHLMTGEKTSYSHKDNVIKEYVLKGLKKFIQKNDSKLQFQEEPKNEDKALKLEDNKGYSIDVSIVVKKGNSAHLTVVDYSEKNAQLVVMATHGHSKLASMFVGSTTANVFRDIKIPVMTIKPDFVR